MLMDLLGYEWGFRQSEPRSAPWRTKRITPLETVIVSKIGCHAFDFFGPITALASGFSTLQYIVTRWESNLHILQLHVARKSSNFSLQVYKTGFCKLGNSLKNLLTLSLQCPRAIQLLEFLNGNIAFVSSSVFWV